MAITMPDRRVAILEAQRRAVRRVLYFADLVSPGYYGSAGHQFVSVTTADGLVAVTVEPDRRHAAAATGREVPCRPRQEARAAWQDQARPQDGRALGQGQDDRVQGQAHAGPHHCAVDPDELQVAP